MRPLGSFPLMPQDIFDDFFNHFSGLDFYNKETQSLSLRDFPKGDVFIDKQGNRVIELTLAGYKKEQLNVEAQDDRLVVSASKCESDDCDSLRTRARRAFKQVFSNLGKGYDLTKTDVSFVDGLLKIVVPKSQEEERAVRLEIK